MRKTLTISIASYNVSAFIDQNLRSIVDSRVADQLEVFVVDDGGMDSTLEIAKKYEADYPGIVYAIHKDNGGYGSVQDYSIKHATGKYFKILDGDDWMDTSGLTMLVDYLDSSNVDVVVTNYKKGPAVEYLKEVKVSKGVPTNVVLDPNDLETTFGMWALTYKTEVLKESRLFFPKHTLYTDRIYASLPFIKAKTIIVLDLPVYCYRTGREGQSVSRESRIKHIDEYLYVTSILCEEYELDKRVKKDYLLNKVSAAYKVSIRALLLLEANKENYDKLVNYELKTKQLSKDVYQNCANIKTRMGIIISVLRLTNYKAYWLIGKIPKTLIDY